MQYSCTSQRKQWKSDLSWKCENYSFISCMVVVLVNTTSKMRGFSKLNVAPNNYQEDIPVAVVM